MTCQGDNRLLNMKISNVAKNDPHYKLWLSTFKTILTLTLQKKSFCIVTLHTNIKWLAHLHTKLYIRHVIG